MCASQFTLQYGHLNSIIRALHGLSEPHKLTRKSFSKYIKIRDKYESETDIPELSWRAQSVIWICVQKTITGKSKR